MCDARRQILFPLPNWVRERHCPAEFALQLDETRGSRTLKKTHTQWTPRRKAHGIDITMYSKRKLIHVRKKIFRLLRWFRTILTDFNCQLHMSLLQQFWPLMRLQEPADFHSFLLNMKISEMELANHSPYVDWKWHHRQVLFSNSSLLVCLLNYQSLLQNSGFYPKLPHFKNTFQYMWNNLTVSLPPEWLRSQHLSDSVNKKWPLET